jgi:hypothetical protein
MKHFLLFLVAAVLQSPAVCEYVCDDNAVHDNIKASRLVPNTFHKICPPIESGSPFGHPQCGDGTNFSFFFSKPPQKKQNKKSILIEFQGGGACWDANTCEHMAGYLTFPSEFDSFVGKSCSEISYGVSGYGTNSRTPINMLCSGQVGDVDFSEYNTGTWATFVVVQETSGCLLSLLSDSSCSHCFPPFFVSLALSLSL